MKKSIIFLCGIITLMSCNVRKTKINKITKQEMSEYNIVQDTIYHNNEKIAYLNLIEWEYFNGKLVQEISVVQFNQSEQHKTIKLISFIHKKHPNAKIEIKFKNEE
jgi:hypothetical protein